jgi:hypothetical protein
MKKKISFKEVMMSFLFVFLFFVVHAADQIYDKAKENPTCFIAVVALVFTLLLILKIIDSRKEKRKNIYINH